MKLLLTGHEERYAIEQLQLSLFPGEQMEPVYGPFQGDGAESILSRGEVYLTATTVIWYRGRKSQCVRRMHLEAGDGAAAAALAAKKLLRSRLSAAAGAAPWGALAGVRPTKITTKFLMEGGIPPGCRDYAEANLLRHAHPAAAVPGGLPGYSPGG